MYRHLFVIGRIQSFFVDNAGGGVVAQVCWDPSLNSSLQMNEGALVIFEVDHVRVFLQIGSRRQIDADDEEEKVCCHLVTT